MTKFDPYEVLGVARDASLHAIKKRYRKLSMANHPDRKPGDENAARRFLEVQRAFELLNDPQRRRRFDETGDIGGDGNDDLDPAERRAMDLITDMVTAIGTQVATDDLPIGTVDLVEMMRTKLNDGAKKTHAEQVKLVEKVVKSKERLAFLAKRFSTKDGRPSRLRQIVELQIEEIDRAMEDAKQRYAAMLRAIELLENDLFEVVKQDRLPAAASAKPPFRTRL
jgi:DnaJ-class molecular chaperone